MANIRLLTASEQVAQFLRKEIYERKWEKSMPGSSYLVKELGVGRNTIDAALKILEDEGFLVPRGVGRRRQIVHSNSVKKHQHIRVRILLYERLDRSGIYITMLMSRLQMKGYKVEIAAKSLKDLNMDMKRIAYFVKKHPVDAWVVTSAPRNILEWFSQQPTPSIALYGSSKGLPMAAAFPITIPCILEAVRYLIQLEHKRIIMFTREERRTPNMSRSEELFLNELESAGIKTSRYNLPEWQETPDGLISKIDQLIRYTPPTAIFFQELPLFLAARTHLASHGIIAPRDISLILLNQDPCLSWHKPEVSHIRFEYERVMRRVERWVNNVARGKNDRRQVGIPSEFIKGGTIGPLPRKNKHTT